MNRLIRRWRAVFIVDAIVKSLLVYGGFVLMSLGTIIVDGIEPVIHVAIFAASLAGLNVMSLILGSRIVASFRYQIMTRHPALQIATVVICATAMFDAILTAIFSLRGNLAWAIDIGLFFSTTSLISIFVVFVFDGMSRLFCPRTEG
ncbi:MULTISPECIES: hypothetical protein [unclassified Bradyrhizobium]|uniref:hypothetical protein n=1 Tax=unclassified Bradyrhizobium TaxID=2631580 RepID=UPI0028E64BC6|nr:MULTISPECIES: hypothetical protein [unclassified Bradyrhizobium]